MTTPNFVFVVDTKYRPLLPCKPSIAKRLLNAGKAAVWRRYPFTIILKKEVTEAVEPMQLKIDPGSKTTGLALLHGARVLWVAELTHRGQQIKDALEQRRGVRRSRRNRHSPYRPARFNNRTRAKGWLAPSLAHRVETTLTWVNRLRNLAPVASVAQELVRFDLQKHENPEISGIEYQQGELAGYEVREYLLNKWGRQCAYCGSQDTALEIEHIQPKSNGGSNRISNLAIACHSCNQKKGAQDVRDFLAKKPDVLNQILAQAKRPLKDAAAVNSTRWALFNRLKATRLTVTTGSGGRTKFNRCSQGIDKSHWADAACVGETPSLEVLASQPLIIKAKGHGNRRLCRINKYGFPCSKARKSYDIPWKTGDIARHDSGVVGRVVVQNAKRLEVRVNGKRTGGKLEQFIKLFSKDGYSYG